MDVGVNITTGTLYIVSTPIGNLEDMTYRAVRVLTEVSVIAAEDTRHTRTLLAHYQIQTPLTSYHDFNKEEKAAALISRLKEGDSIALVSDAGTPTISDPGYFLINQAILAKIPVSPIPGPSAAIAALSISGLPTDRFAFEGFTPRKKGARAKKLMALQSDPRTLIFYESPYRVLGLLQEIEAIFGNRRVALCREMTKKFEEVIYDDVHEVIHKLSAKKLLGEFTFVVEGNKEKGR
ncbi:MAG: 16S rRNA (cytidine(1402)-2'-O)-methyltransferase [Nitrospirae bacterium]|nr:16S rRNA (cytidine(1402)-2'-O)-methyltransferase [Nitrospirota bacterium]MBI3598620.1 16S rRNA (cytidine(1402)-2'-O)-methyltransferase [Candidatus Troglogloeales bacterium]